MQVETSPPGSAPQTERRPFGSWPIRPPCPMTWCNLGTFSRCGPNWEVCCSGLDILKRPSIWFCWVGDAGHGVIVYMRQEGRGSGLGPKIQAYKLQENGYDTVEANRKLGYPMDLREYGLGAQILTDLGLKTIRLLTNNPKKIVGLEGYGLKIRQQVPITVRPNPHNLRYLKTKREKLGHLL